MCIDRTRDGLRSQVPDQLLSADVARHVRPRTSLRDDGNKTTAQLNWRFPLGAKLKGYGESLVDYQYRDNPVRGTLLAC